MFPRWIWFVIAACGILIAAIHGTDLVGDRGMANPLTMLLVVLVLAVALAWFTFFSRAARRRRLIVGGASLAAVATFFAMLRIDSVSGELLPSFVFRWSHKPDQLLPAVETGQGDAARPPVDLRTTTEYDFPQFLGKDRNLAVDNVALARDWAGQPPKLVWRHPIGAGWSSFAVVNGHAVTMEQRGEQELVTCYNVRSGKLEWVNSIRARYDLITGGVGPRSTPTIDDGLVYSLGATGLLQCLDGATGKRRWARDLLEDYHIKTADEASNLPWGRSASPLVVDGLVIVPGGGPSGGPFVSLVAMDKKTGKTVWEGGDRQISYSSPAVATLGGVRQVLIVNEADVTGHDLKTGKVLWEHPWSGRSNSSANVSQAVPVAPDCVFVSKAYGKGASLIKLVPSGKGVFDAEVVWANSKIMKTKFSNVAIKDGFVYGLSDGVLECVELANGRRGVARGPVSAGPNPVRRRSALGIEGVGGCGASRSISQPGQPCFGAFSGHRRSDVEQFRPLRSIPACSQRRGSRLLRVAAGNKSPRPIGMKVGRFACRRRSPPAEFCRHRAYSSISTDRDLPSSFLLCAHQNRLFCRRCECRRILPDELLYAQRPLGR